MSSSRSNYFISLVESWWKTFRNHPDGSRFLAARWPESGRFSFRLFCLRGLILAACMEIFGKEVMLYG